MPAHNPTAMALSLAASATARGRESPALTPAPSPALKEKRARRGLERQREHDAEELLHVDADGAFPPQRLLLYLDCFFENFRLDGEGGLFEGLSTYIPFFPPKLERNFQGKKR